MAPWGEGVDKLGSGLPDRFRFTVTSARIGYPFEKNPTQAALVLEGEQRIDDDVEDQHIWLKAGEQFEPGDKEGTFWLHQSQTPDVFDDPSSKRKKLNKNSGYGKFLNSLLAVAGTEPLETNQDPARSKYEIWDVTFWEGLVLDVEVADEPYSFTNPQGELIEGSKRQEYVVGVLGKSDGTAAPSATTAVSPATNGAVDPKSFDSHLAYLEAYVEAGGDTGDEAATKAFWTSARA